MVDPEPYTPCSLTFKVPNTVTDVAETAVVDHGRSHDIDITIKGHLQETGQEVGNLRIWRRGDNGWWSRVLRKGACNHRRKKVRRP